MFTLRAATSPLWTEAVLNDFDLFLNDHAAAEKKASGMAMSMALHYRDKTRLVNAMVDLAIEELTHFREVVHLLNQRQLILAPDERDPYVNALRKQCRIGEQEGLIDRLITGSIIEARGAERFGLVAEALTDDSLKRFYTSIARSEAKHFQLFIELANHYFAATEVQARLDQLLDFEAQLVTELPPRPALH